MKNIFKILLPLLFSANVYSQSGWFEQESGTDITLHSVQMTDHNTGYAVGGDILLDGNSNALDRGVIIKTTNGGISWLTQTPSGFDKILYSVCFLNNSTGYAAGKDNQNHAVFKTTNGGNNWIQQSLPSAPNTPPLLDLSFINTENGYAAGLGPVIFKTTNGGTNWSLLSFPYQTGMYSIEFTSLDTGYAGTDKVIYITTNGGISWDTNYYRFNTSVSYRSIFFFDANYGHAAGNGELPYTTNGGNYWFGGGGFLQSVKSVYFPSKWIGYCAGENNIIYKSSNGGNIWYNQLSLGLGSFNSIHFINDTIGVAVGDGGLMYRTVTGGTVGIINISSEIPSEFRLKQNYPNPFNPETVIEFELPANNRIKISVYDINGRIVNELNETLSAGTFKYDFDGSKLPAGVYFYRLSANNFTQVRKMVLIK